MSSKRREKNNNENPVNNGPDSKRQTRMSESNESLNNEPRELIITDYNPFDVYKLYNDGNSYPLITEQINPVKISDDKHFFYPSSFGYKSLEPDASGFAPVLCIHKFKHNNYANTPPSYKLHPIVLDILEKRSLKNEKLIRAFTGIKAGQTLLVNLVKSITWKELDELQRKYASKPDGFNYSVLRETPIRLGDPNTSFETTSLVNYDIPAPIPVEEEGAIHNGRIENENSMHVETVGMGEAVVGNWSQGMATPPRANATANAGKENFPPKNMDGTPGTPTQIRPRGHNPLAIGGSYSKTKSIKRTKRTKLIKHKNTRTHNTTTVL